VRNRFGCTKAGAEPPYAIRDRALDLWQSVESLQVYHDFPSACPSIPMNERVSIDSESLRKARAASWRLFKPKLITVMREGYGWAHFQNDAVAGLTVAIVALPLAMALAIASGTTRPRTTAATCSASRLA